MKIDRRIFTKHTWPYWIPDPFILAALGAVILGAVLALIAWAAL